MYDRVYGIIETLAPLHVGATAGEESGNLNLIFRDQFTQTGIIPGSSIRGRLRSDMRLQLADNKAEVDYWYGKRAQPGIPDSTTESAVKFEYASIVWLPVFCPGQPIVWVSCPRLLKRYRRIAVEALRREDGSLPPIPEEYTRSLALNNPLAGDKLFFNFGLLNLESAEDLSCWFPQGQERPAVVVGDSEIAMIHDMALYRQSRVKLMDKEKRVDGGQFFNVEALPEETIMVFPIAIKPQPEGASWQPFAPGNKGEIYLGGLESIGFGHCEITISEVKS